VFEFRRQRRSVRESASSAFNLPAIKERSVDETSLQEPSSESSSQLPSLRSGAAGSRPARRVDAPSSPRELPDVTGFLVVVLVTLGLFVVPVGATIMQGPAIVASILGR